jgi:glycosyltransferase involved in cell wall biosynthesis
MTILFLDQSGKLGGAELCLLDIAEPYRSSCHVALLADGPFRAALEQRQIPVSILHDRPIAVHKDSNWLAQLAGASQLLPTIRRTIALARTCDLIYANTPKALVIGAIAAAICNRPLIYHLHDILSADHFSDSNLRLLVTLANRADRVIANSIAAQTAYRAIGGSRPCSVIYNGFDINPPLPSGTEIADRRRRIGADQDAFVIGHFSRLSPWKGQDVLIDALQNCPANVQVLLVGAALFGEDDYAAQLRTQVDRLGLGDRVHFLGFQDDIAAWMSACDLVVHSSTAPEPFGRVIVEAMLCRRPVIAAAAGGALEILDDTCGWLTQPGDSQALAAAITDAYDHPDKRQRFTDRGYQQARSRFGLASIRQQTDEQLAPWLRPLNRRAISSVG